MGGKAIHAANVKRPLHASWSVAAPRTSVLHVSLAATVPSGVRVEEPRRSEGAKQEAKEDGAGNSCHENKKLRDINEGAKATASQILMALSSFASSLRYFAASRLSLPFRQN
jgi:hypothetical protein